MCVFSCHAGINTSQERERYNIMSKYTQQERERNVAFLLIMEMITNSSGGVVRNIQQYLLKI